MSDRRWFAIIVALASIACGGPTRRSIMGFDAVDRSAKTVDDGGFDLRVSSTEFSVREILPCGTEIAKVVETWATEHTLSISRREVSSNRVLIHLTQPTTEGLLEFLYRSTPSRARVVFDYIDMQSRTTGAEHTRLFRESEIRGFRDALLEAVKCRNR